MVGELRFHMPHGMAKQLKQQQIITFGEKRRRRLSDMFMKVH